MRHNIIHRRRERLRVAEYVRDLVNGFKLYRKPGFGSILCLVILQSFIEYRQYPCVICSPHNSSPECVTSCFENVNRKSLTVVLHHTTDSCARRKIANGFYYRLLQWNWFCIALQLNVIASYNMAVKLLKSLCNFIGPFLVCIFLCKKICIFNCLGIRGQGEKFSA